jgi:O-antigen/teichoic acid export membrane protein
MAPLQEFAGSTLYRILTLAVQFLITVVVTRLCGAEGFGLYSLIIVNASLLHLFTSLGIPSGITHHAAAGLIGWSGLKRIIILSTMLQCVVLLFVEGASFAFSGHSWTWPSGTWPAAVAGMAFFLSVSLTEKYTAWFLGMHRQGRSNFIAFLCALGPLLVLSMLIIVRKVLPTQQVIGILIAFSVFQAVWLALASPQLSSDGHGTAPGIAISTKVFLRYSAVNYLANAVQFLAYRIDYWIVDHYHGQAELGIYALAVRLGQMLWIVPVVAASILFPLGSAGKADTALLGRLLRLLVPFSLLIAFLMAILSPWLLPLVFGTAFAPSIRPLLFLLPGILLFSINIILAAWFAGTGRPRYNLYVAAVSCLLILILDLAWIPAHGAVGAAWASTVAYSSSAIMSLWLYRKDDHSGPLRLLPAREDIRYFMTTFVKPKKS